MKAVLECLSYRRRQQVTRMDRTPPTLNMKVKALTDMWVFLDMINFRGGVSTFSELHKEMVRFNTAPNIKTSRSNRRRIFLVPRDHRKSTVNSVGYTLWRLYRNPNLRILLGGNEKRLTLGFIRELREYFQDPWLQDCVWNDRPHIKGRMIPKLRSTSGRAGESRRKYEDTDASDTKILWNNERLQLIRTRSVGKEPSVFACSVGVSVTGDHYDIVIIDDIVDRYNSKTPELAESVASWAKDLESVLTRQIVLDKVSETFCEYIGNEVIVNGTRYYSWDYYSKYVGDGTLSLDEMHLKASQKRFKLFFRTIYVNGVDNSDGYIFPERFNKAVDQELQEDLGLKEYYAQYHNRIVGTDEDALNTDLVVNVPYNQILENSYGVLTIDRGNGDPLYVPLVMCVDPAVSARKKNCNPAIAIGGYDVHGNLYALELVDKKLTPTELINEIFRLSHKYKLTSVTIEIGGQQEVFVHLIEQKAAEPNSFPLGVREIYHGEDKIGRIKFYLEPLLSAGRMHFFPQVLGTAAKSQMQTLLIPTAKKDAVDVLAILAEVARRPSGSRGGTGGVVDHIQVNNIYGGSY